MTGYRANAALDNWCYFDGTTCHDTQTNTAIGVHIDSNNDWVKGKVNYYNVIFGLEDYLKRSPSLPANSHFLTCILK